MYPSIAQALSVKWPATCIHFGVMNNGNHEPPSDDITRMTSIEMPSTCF